MYIRVHVYFYLYTHMCARMGRSSAMEALSSFYVLQPGSLRQAAQSSYSGQAGGPSG